MNKNVFFLVIALLLSSTIIKAQNEDNKWVVGVSGALTSFGNKGTVHLMERYNLQVPKINIARYLFKGLTLDGAMSLSAINEVPGFYGNAFSYFSMDLTLRYDFNQSDENLVPYLGVGGSLVGAPSTRPGSNMTSTVNFGGGGTFWFSPRFGLNAQILYKISPDKFQSMISHSQLSVGLVFSLGRRVMNYRLWDNRY